MLGGMERRRLREGETEAMGKNRVITIGRQLGSGGSYIGREVARRLGIECYDKRLIELACKYGNVDLERMKDAEEKRANPFLFSVPREVQNDRTGHGGSINDMVFNLQSAVIRQLAERSPVSSSDAVQTMCSGSRRMCARYSFFGSWKSD